MNEQMNVLISLYKGYGLGDAMQMSAVLRHVQAAFPNWHIHYRAEEGKHQVARGLVADHFAYGKEPPDQNYLCEIQICLYDTWANWGDRPNTRVSSTLHEVFGIPWKPEYGRYQITVSNMAQTIACSLLRHSHCVALHYEGDSAQEKKNLTHDQAKAICRAVEEWDETCEPIILDWRDRSPLVTYRRISSPPRWGGDAELVAAVISNCKAFIGIDSGPGKVAGATETPSLIIWTGHHPAPFYDPAPNVTHLVPCGYHGLFPVFNDAGVIQWFEEHYNVRMYDNNDPVPEARRWLEEILK